MHLFQKELISGLHIVLVHQLQLEEPKESFFWEKKKSSTAFTSIVSYNFLLKSFFTKSKRTKSQCDRYGEYDEWDIKDNVNWIKNFHFLENGFWHFH